MSETNSRGNSVYIKYESVESTCDQILDAINKIKTSTDSIREILNDKNNVWRGTAANKYWTMIEKGQEEASLSNIEDIIENKFKTLVDETRDLISKNKYVDTKLSELNNIDANTANDNVQANTITTNAEGVNEELNNSVKANDNVQANATTTNAYGVNEELNNSVKANDNIQANNTTTNAYGVNEELNNSVNINGNIQGNDTTTKASGIDTQLINDISVGTGIANSSTITNASTLNDALFNHVGMKDLSADNNS